MNKFRVLMAVDIEGTIHHFGSVIELDEATAAAYAHALLRVEEEKVEGK
jgi:hypothetical protein